MKNKKFYIFTALIFLFCILVLNSSLAYTKEEQIIINQAPYTLSKLGILKGNGQGDLMLGRNITRAEFLTLVIRLGNNEDLTVPSSIDVSFFDLDTNRWWYKNMRLSYYLGLVKGYPDNSIRPDNNINFAEALTIIIRYLGYENKLTGSWPENIISMANNIGLNKYSQYSYNKTLTRKEAAVIIYNALTVPYPD